MTNTNWIYKTSGLDSHILFNGVLVLTLLIVAKILTRKTVPFINPKTADAK